jgi:hypothetical protein
MLGAVTAVSALAACSGSTGSPGSAYASHAAQAATVRGGTAAVPVAVTRAPAAADTVLPDTAPGAVTTAFARSLFTSAPVVVLSGTSVPASRAAEADARSAHAPMLLPSRLSAAGLAQLAASVKSFHPVAVLAEGLPASWPHQLAARLPGVKVVGKPAALPATQAPRPLGRLAVLVPAVSAAKSSTSGASIAAVTATAEAVGGSVVGMSGTDPRADPAAIAVLSHVHPSDVIAVGAQFGPAARLASRIAVAATGRQLPGGGQVMFPGRRLVALYGHPGTPGLGVLGQQDLSASIARARKLAAAYRPLSHVPVVPAFEIIATVAEGSPGADGTYSYETPVSELLPWVRRATADGLYVVLDLQPGRASLLTQAEHYQRLLELPDVGLALDAEWKLQPGQKPLRQIGHVGISEVNDVADWLAALTARHNLPQKLLVLHQFQLAMLAGERQLDTGHDDLAVVIHMDGQGTPGVKQGTWDAVTGAAPRGVSFGWKNFLVKDHPMLTPGQTMTKTPTPVMISYQ